MREARYGLIKTLTGHTNAGVSREYSAHAYSTGRLSMGTCEDQISRAKNHTATDDPGSRSQLMTG